MIQITCSADANPPPVFTVYQAEDAVDTELSTQTSAALVFKAAVTLTKESDGQEIYCQDALSSVKSAPVIFQVTCRCIRCISCISFIKVKVAKWRLFSFLYKLAES